MDLTSEENKAIGYLNDFKSIKIMYGNTFTMFLEQLKKYQQATDTILNLVEKQQKEIEEKDRQYDSLVNVAIEAVFSEINDEVEILARVLCKQGQIKFDKEKKEYINPMKEFELFGAKYTKNKVILDEENYIPKDAIREKIKENNKLINECINDEEHCIEIPLYEHDNKILKELLGEDKLCIKE